MMDGDVMRLGRKARKALESPQPPDVPGFREAQEHGLVPIVSASTPVHPTPSLTPTAAEMFRTFLIRSGVTGAVVIGFLFGIAPRLEVPLQLDSWLGVVASAVWMWLLFFRWLPEPFERALEECMHGYATLTLIQGRFRSQQHPAWARPEVGMPWNFSGVWVLDCKFQVQFSPRSGFSPPGFYPSPHEPDLWELWTGVVWSGTYQDGPLVAD